MNNLFFYSLSICIYTNILLSAQEKPKLPFFDLPHDIQREIICYAPSTDLFIFNKNFVLTQKIAREIIEHKVRTAYKKLDTLYDDCAWGSGHRTYTDEFQQQKEQFFYQLNGAFKRESQERQKIWLNTLQTYADSLQEHYNQLSLPQAYSHDYSRSPFLLTGPSLYVNCRETYLLQGNFDDQTFSYHIIKALLLIDKLVLFNGDFPTDSINKKRFFPSDHWYIKSNITHVKLAPLFNLCDERSIQELLDIRKGWKYWQLRIYRWLFVFIK